MAKLNLSRHYSKSRGLLITLIWHGELGRKRDEEGREEWQEMVVKIHTATARFSDVNVSSSVPTDMSGSKMAPYGSTNDTVKFSLKVIFLLGIKRVLEDSREDESTSDH